MILFGFRGEDSLVRWLWAGGVILFAASALLGLRARRSAHPEAQTSPHFGWVHITILVIILGAALAAVLSVGQDPQRFSRRHGSPWTDRSLDGARGAASLSRYVGQPSSHGFFPAAISLKVFGNNLFGLQMTSVLGGMMSLLGFLFVSATVRPAPVGGTGDGAGGDQRGAPSLFPHR